MLRVTLGVSAHALIGNSDSENRRTQARRFALRLGDTHAKLKRSQLHLERVCFL